MSNTIIVGLQQKNMPDSIGNKAQNLRKLIQIGCQVPVSFVIPWEAHHRFKLGDTLLVEEIRQALESKLNPDLCYAVRSSANFEDQLENSFAGQFKSFLDVSGVDHILDSVWTIWETAASPQVEAYLHHKEVEGTELKMAVIIQEMVPPVVSGVVFSKNPLTGLNEIIIEAISGRGDALVQGGITPHRWVYKYGRFFEEPKTSPLSAGVVKEIIDQTRKIVDKTKKNVDLEFVFDGSNLHWVQVREITAVENLALYSNRISKEVLPGMIKPLVWSVNVPLVNQVWIDILTELIGPNDLKPDQLAKAFYYRAYFNMGRFGSIFSNLGMPPEMLERMMGLIPEDHPRPLMKLSLRTFASLPRLLRFSVEKFGFSSQIDSLLPVMQSEFNRFPLAEIQQLDDSQILIRINRLYQLVQRTAYFNILVPLLMFVYNRILKYQLHGSGIEYEDLDLLKDQAEITQYDPNFHLKNLHAKYKGLSIDHKQHIEMEGINFLFSAPDQDPTLHDFQEAFVEFIDRFGHLSDSGNDFSSIPWRENQESILKMVVDFEAIKHKSRLVDFASVPLPIWKKWIVQKVYQRACQYRLYREKVSSLYTFGYGLMRSYFLALGILWSRKGLISQPDDIFYLEHGEIEYWAGQVDYDASLISLVAQRRDDMEQVRDVIPPETIFGDQAPPVHLSIGERFVGTPTSPGYFTGSVVVVKGLDDFDKVQPNMVVVVPFSDVGWTPLFSKAGAIISESGGMLSHSSIIAREYGIPAVVSVPNATQLIDGLKVTVDGYRGEVVLSAG